MGADPSEAAMAMDRDEEESDEEEVLVEEREAEMVSLQNPDAPVRRKGWFLKSCSPNGNVGRSPPLVPSSFRSPNSVTIEEPRVQFKGWASSPRHWEQWVAKLLPKFGEIWKKVHIFDAILASTCRIRRDPSSLFGLVSHWSEETNTFLFPWGEITVTLEDIIILTGFSVLGEPVRAPLPPELREIENRLNEERLKFNRSSSKKAHHSAWVKEFIERENDDLEHAAFLSLWLSRFVLSSHPESTIRQNVFPIAARLSTGQRIALAPSILSSIYRDLREIKRSITNNPNNSNPNSSSSIKETSLVCWAPLQILQIWIWERFPNLRPESLNPLKEDQPRAARWHDIGKKLHPVLIHQTLTSHTNFLFRPYAISSSDWYKEGLDELIRDDELRSFAQCLCPCELVGLDSIEFYLPNRVAMQFGFDQDLPNYFTRVDFGGWEVSWQSYEITADNMSLYVPPQPFEPGLTVEYMTWWRENMIRCFGNSGIGVGNSGIVEVSENSGKGKNKRKKGLVGLSEDKKRKVKDFYNGENKMEGGIVIYGENKMEEKDLMAIQSSQDNNNNNVMEVREDEIERETRDLNPIPIMIPNPISIPISIPIPNPSESEMADEEEETDLNPVLTNQDMPPVTTHLDAPEEDSEEETETEPVPVLTVPVNTEPESPPIPNEEPVEEVEVEMREEESEYLRERKWRYERYAAEMRARRQAEEARLQREIVLLRKDIEILKDECFDLENIAGISHERL